MEASAFNPVVIAPTYNNARTLSELIAGVRALGLPLIVVNDGSTDETVDVLKLAPAGVAVLHHPRNRGKAAALHTGFEVAAQTGFTHAISIDTDGQHDPAEIPRLLEVAQREPEALVLGLRDEGVPGYPAKSRLGRRLSNLFIQMESGLRVEDSQCGMRVYPLGLVQTVRCGASRYGFETEIVTRAAWAGCEVRQVPVTCRYLPPEVRVSHLNPWRDSFRAIGMHAKLLARALLPWPRPPRWPVRAAVEVSSASAWNWRGFFRWLNPAEAWRQARRDRVSREAFSAGLATGAFIGNLPTYGLHAFLGLYAARRLHLHPVAVVIGSHISTPPVGPILNAAAIVVGHLILHGSLPTRGDFDVRAKGFFFVLKRMLLEWVIGSPIIGLLCAIVVFMISSRLLRLAAAKDSQADTPGSSEVHPTESAPGHAA